MELPAKTTPTGSWPKISPIRCCTIVPTMIWLSAWYILTRYSHRGRGSSSRCRHPSGALRIPPRWAEVVNSFFPLQLTVWVPKVYPSYEAIGTHVLDPSAFYAATQGWSIPISTPYVERRPLYHLWCHQIAWERWVRQYSTPARAAAKETNVSNASCSSERVIRSIAGFSIVLKWKIHVINSIKTDLLD